MAAAEIAAGRAATDPQPRPAAGHEDSLSLSAVVLYLGQHWLGASAEVSELLAQDSILKKRLRGLRIS